MTIGSRLVLTIHCNHHASKLTCLEIHPVVKALALDNISTTEQLVVLDPKIMTIIVTLLLEERHKFL